jgi:osmoprotectant transport system permease protein
MVAVAAVTGAVAVGGPAPVSVQATTDTAQAPAARVQGPPIVIGSKQFGESYLLAEMFAQLLEARGYVVDRRLGLGATEIAFGALREGAIDLYPEYTGTGLLAILGESRVAEPRAVYRIVSERFRERWGVRWLPPLGFENTYAISVRQETADSLGLNGLSDLSLHGEALVAGLSPDFIGREDGLPGLEATYGLTLNDVRSLLQAVKYEALAQRQVDVIDGYSTDGQIARYDLRVLEDDRSFFPPYEAAALVGRRLWNDRPGAVRALTELSGTMDERMVQVWNERLDVDGEPVERVARDALVELDLVTPDVGSATPVVTEEGEGSETLATYLFGRRGDLFRLTRRHLFLVLVSMLAAVLLAVPLGLALERTPGLAEGVIRSVGVLQTIPSIALLAFMIPLFGIGAMPAIVALFAYSLFPIVRNTYTGVRDADPAAVEASTAVGMTPAQVLRWVRLPLAAPVIMAGVRTAAVINVGTATLAAFIGAGGLGDPIVSGLALSDTRMILSGAIPAAILALLVDVGLGGVERRVTPSGVREAR